MSEEFRYVYRAQGPKLDAYIACPARRVFIRGPLGSGKTNASCWKLFRAMCAQRADANGIRKSRWAAIRNTYPDLLGTTAKDWLEMCGQLGKYRQSGYEPPTHYLAFRLQDSTVVNAELVFMALDRQEHVRKLRGTQLTGAWLNETKELPFAVLQMIDLRVGRYPVEVEPTWYGIFGDTNAPDSDHWYYRMAEVDKPDGWVFITQPGGLKRANATAPWEFNPEAENIANLPGRHRYYVEGAQGKREDWIKVNLANEYGYVQDGKPVYPDYIDSLHCQPFEIVREWGIHIGLDFGLTPAAQFGQRTPSGLWRVRWELCTESTGIIRFADVLKKFIAEQNLHGLILSITGDPSGDARQEADRDERTVFQILEANGVAALPAFTNDFAIRTEAYAAPMRRLIDGKPGFMIHPDCKVSRKGLAGAYCFRRLKVAGDERYRDEPDKNAFSHPCEAGQYMVMGAGEGHAVKTASTVDDKRVADEFRKMMGYA